jgi:hypothetical protein
MASANAREASILPTESESNNRPKSLFPPKTLLHSVHAVDEAAIVWIQGGRCLMITPFIWMGLGLYTVFRTLDLMKVNVLVSNYKRQEVSPSFVLGAPVSTACQRVVCRRRMIDQHRALRVLCWSRFSAAHLLGRTANCSVLVLVLRARARFVRVFLSLPCLLVSLVRLLLLLLHLHRLRRRSSTRVRMMCSSSMTTTSRRQ